MQTKQNWRLSNKNRDASKVKSSRRSDRKDSQHRVSLAKQIKPLPRAWPREDLSCAASPDQSPLLPPSALLTLPSIQTNPNPSLATVHTFTPLTAQHHLAN